MRIENRNLTQNDLSLKITNKKCSAGTSAPRKFEARLPIFETLGFSFYLGWILLLYWGSPLAPLSYYTDSDAHLMRIIMSASVALCYLIIGIFAKPLASKVAHALLVVCVLLFAPANGIVLLAGKDLPSLLLITSWAITGIGHAMILILWSKHLVLFNRKQLIMICSISFIAAGLMYIFISYLQQMPGTIAAMSLPVISLFFFAFSDNATDEKIEILRKEIMPRNNRINLVQLYIYSVTYCIALGFMGACVSLEVFQTVSVPYIGLANCLAGILMIFLLIRFKRDVARFIATICLPFMALGTFLFAFSEFLGAWAQLLCIAFLFFIFACNDVINITDVSKSSGLFGIDYIRTFGFGRFPNGLGVFFGWVIGYLVFFFYEGTSWGIVFVSFLIVVLFIFANTAFIGGGNKRDVSDDQARSESDNAEPSGSKESKAEKNRTLGLVSQTINGRETMLVDRIAASVNILVDDYSLSNRQAEVLSYLARGRNAEYIQEVLFVSNHTAKSHIYSIYRKLGVHSQQELINMVEELFKD